MQKSHKKIPPYQLVGGIFQLYIFVISSVHLTGDTPNFIASLKYDTNKVIANFIAKMVDKITIMSYHR